MLEYKVSVLLNIPLYIYEGVKDQVAKKQAERVAELPPEIPPKYTKKEVNHMLNVEGLSTFDINQKIAARAREIDTATEVRRAYAKRFKGKIPKVTKVTRTEVILELIEKGLQVCEQQDAVKPSPKVVSIKPKDK